MMISIHLGDDEKGAARKAALERLAQQFGVYWNGEPSIGRLIVEIAEGHIKLQEANMERVELDYGVRYILPTTLAQVEVAGVEYSGEFGADESEHGELLSDPDILRVVAGIEVDGDSIGRTIWLESLEARLSDGEAKWRDCSRRYSDPRGWVENQMYRQNADRMWQLVPSDIITRLEADEEMFRAQIES